MLYELITLPTPWTGKIDQMRTERQRWSHPASSGPPAVSRKKDFPENHIINPLVNKPVPSIFSSFYFASIWTSTPSRSTSTQKWSWPISMLVNNPSIMSYSLSRAHFTITQGTGAIRVNTTFLEGRLGLMSKRPSYPPTGTRLSPRSVLISY